MHYNAQDKVKINCADGGCPSGVTVNYPLIAGLVVQSPAPPVHVSVLGQDTKPHITPVSETTATPSSVYPEFPQQTKFSLRNNKVSTVSIYLHEQATLTFCILHSAQS